VVPHLIILQGLFCRLSIVTGTSFTNFGRVHPLSPKISEEAVAEALLVQYMHTSNVGSTLGVPAKAHNEVLHTHNILHKK